MTWKFATKSPKMASGAIYAAGFIAGTLLGGLAAYLISGVWKGSGMGFGACCGVLALSWAQRKGIVPRPEELNKPISLFGPGGFHDDHPR